MVAPLDVPAVVFFHEVHDDVCAGSSVVDVAKDVQLVDHQPLDDVGQGDDEVVGPSGRDDGLDDDFVISNLVILL